MKLQSLVQFALAALLPATAAVAVALPLPDATPESPEMSLEARDVVKRGLCTPTGPGVCNLGLKFESAYLPPPRRNIVKYDVRPDVTANIYDRYCNVIGNNNNVQPGTNIYSQLPWVMVCVAVGGSVESPTWDFHYGDQDIDYIRGCSCSVCSDYPNDTCCQCAFLC